MYINKLMTSEVVTIVKNADIMKARELMLENNFRHLPVVNESKQLLGIGSDSDLLRAFINVLGINEPGVLLGIVADENATEMKKIVDTMVEENITFGNILVARHWDKGKRAVFPYLLSQNIAVLKKKLKNMGFSLLDPSEWMDAN